MQLGREDLEAALVGGGVLGGGGGGSMTDDRRSAAGTFWNEYMTCERQAARLATFPDLIVTIDADTGLPLTTADLAAGRRTIVLTAPALALKLGAGLRVRNNLAAIEPVVGKEILGHLPEPC